MNNINRKNINWYTVKNLVYFYLTFKTTNRQFIFNLYDGVAVADGPDVFIVT